MNQYLMFGAGLNMILLVCDFSEKTESKIKQWRETSKVNSDNCQWAGQVSPRQECTGHLCHQSPHRTGVYVNYLVTSVGTGIQHIGRMADSLAWGRWVNLIPRLLPSSYVVWEWGSVMSYFLIWACSFKALVFSLSAVKLLTLFPWILRQYCIATFPGRCTAPTSSCSLTVVCIAHWHREVLLEL